MPMSENRLVPNRIEIYCYSYLLQHDEVVRWYKYRLGGLEGCKGGWGCGNACARAAGNPGLSHPRLEQRSVLSSMFVFQGEQTQEANQREGQSAETTIA